MSRKKIRFFILAKKKKYSKNRIKGFATTITVSQLTIILTNTYDYC